MVEMLAKEGYAVTPGTLDELQRKGYIQPPASGVWFGEQVVQLCRTLNSLRRWKPGPNQFDAMKSAIRLMVEAGDDTPLKRLEGSTIELLLLQITESDDRDTRELLREAIIRRMDLVGFVEE